MNLPADDRRRLDDAEGVRAAFEAVRSQFRDLFQHHADATLLVDHQRHPGVVIAINPAAAALYGHSPGEIEGALVTALEAPEPSPEVTRARLNAVLAGGHAAHSALHRTRDGRETPVDVRVSITRMEGREYLLHSHRARAAEPAGPVRPAPFESVFRQTPSAIGLIDAQTLAFVEINDVQTEWTGYSRDELIGIPVAELAFWAAPAEAEAMINAAARGERIRNQEVHVRARDGQVLTWLFSANRSELAGRDWIVFGARDITERKQRQAETLQARDMLESVLRNVPDLIGFIDPESGMVQDVHGHLVARRGYRRQEMIGRDPVAAGLWDDLEATDAILAAIDEHGRIESLEVRHQEPGQAEMTALVSAELVDIAGRLSILFSLHDISERVRQQEQVRSAYELFEAVFRHAPEGMALYNTETGRFVEVNDFLASATGYDREEWIGQRPADIGAFIDPDTMDDLCARSEGGARLTGYETEIRAGPGATATLLLSVENIELLGVRHLLIAAQNITERIGMERALQQSEERYRAFIEQTSDAVYRIEVDPPFSVDLPEEEQIGLLYDRGIIAEANNAFARVNGFARAEDVIGLRRSALVSREEFGRRRDVYEMVRSGYRIEGEEWYTAEIGSIRRIFTISTVGIIEQGQLQRIWHTERDLTEVHLAQEALRASDQRLRTIMDNAPVGLFALDSAGIFTYASGAVFARLGIDPVRDLIGRPAEQIFAAASRGMELTEAALSGERLSITVDINGVPVDISTTPVLDDQGRITGIIGVGIDATDRRRADLAMIQAQKFETMGVLAGGLAHDFNNLLVGVLGNADLALAMLGADDPAVPALQDVVTAAQRARELTAQMLTVSGKQQTPEQPVDLNAIIRETLQLLRVSIPAAVILEDAFEADLPLTRGDPSQLRQIIMNLVINAADAIGQDDGRIRIATSTVTVPRDVARPDYVLTPRPGTYACLEVRDSGPGMDEETVARVFDPFFTTKPTGHGLGLPAVLGIVRGHGGTIRVESRAGQGTEFRVLLPLMAQQGSESAPRPQPVRPAAAGGILIVEDDDAIRSMLGRAMEARGFRAFLARDGVEGVEAFRSHAGEVACVLMDIMMPRLNGLDALTQMREHRQDVPVILMSGYVENEIPARLIGSSVAAFIRKPFRLADLDEVLRQVISTRQDI